MARCKSVGCNQITNINADFCDECVEIHASLDAETHIDPNKPGEKIDEYTGKSVSYYKVPIDYPMAGGTAYTAECGDIIEALGMDYNEGNAFKAIWRKCAARTLGLKKQGYKDGIYDSEKVTYFGERMVVLETRKKAKETQMA